MSDPSLSPQVSPDGKKRHFWRPNHLDSFRLDHRDSLLVRLDRTINQLVEFAARAPPDHDSLHGYGVRSWFQGHLAVQSEPGELQGHLDRAGPQQLHRARPAW